MACSFTEFFQSYQQSNQQRQNICKFGIKKYTFKSSNVCPTKLQANKTTKLSHLLTHLLTRSMVALHDLARTVLEYEEPWHKK